MAQATPNNEESAEIKPRIEGNWPPNFSAGHKTSVDLVGRIRKLRWIGMEAEAAEVQTQLTHCPVPPEDVVLATPLDTD